MEDFYFILDSDIHFGENNDIIGIRNDKKNNVENIIKDIDSNENIKCVIVAGDLTNHGWDAKQLLCWQNGSINECASLIENYIKPIEKKVPLYLCAGNHDTFVNGFFYLHKPIFNLIKSRHKSLRYSFDINNVHFICCHIYPDDDCLKWLKNDLQKHINKEIVIFFHYNLKDEYSDWWSEPHNELQSNIQKEKFYNVIQNYKVIAILCGHYHKSYTYAWKEIPIISCGGPGYGLCHYIRDNGIGKIMVEFKKN